MNTTVDRKHAAEQLEPGSIPPDYYDFEFYVSKERMVTYWHQADEILRIRPDRILEIGIGNRIVAGIIGAFGITTTTADINPALNPDVVTPIAELDRRFEPAAFPFVLCARVLQHLPFEQFEPSLRQLHHVTAKHLLLTLPVETLRVYIRLRITGRSARTFSIPFPLFVKRLLQGKRTTSDRAGDDARTQNFWKINQSRRTAMPLVKTIISRYFTIERAYQVPEDMSHAFFLLTRR